MPSLVKIVKQLTQNRYYVLFLSVIVICSLNGCNDNSDQVVNETTPNTYFEVDQLIEAQIDLNDSNVKERVVVVEGIIEDINNLNNRHTVILKGKERTNTLVICDMQDTQRLALEHLKVGDNLAIKGILKGSLKDIILLNCIISNSKTNE